RHAASVRPEPGSNSPIKFVSGSKLANHFMIDSSTLSLFSFQRAISQQPLNVITQPRYLSTTFSNCLV
ncbi:hypothetical protein, partial [Brevibacillus sp. AY1]